MLFRNALLFDVIDPKLLNQSDASFIFHDLGILSLLSIVVIMSDLSSFFF